MNIFMRYNIALAKMVLKTPVEEVYVEKFKLTVEPTAMRFQKRKEKPVF